VDCINLCPVIPSLYAVIFVGSVLPYDNTKVASFLPGFGKRFKMHCYNPMEIGSIAELSRYSEYGQTSIAEHLRLRIGILIKLPKRLK
jgi:hypothetical protein